MSIRQSDFYKYVGQTSKAPLGFRPVRGEGCWLYDSGGNRYLDLIAGISVSNVGHGNRAVLQAIVDQSTSYTHSMVYGEHIQSPQVGLARALVGHLPDTLNQVFFTNSGAEAIEGAMKLARRVTGRPQVVALRGGYHGNTHATLALQDSAFYSGTFRPLMPGVRFIAPGRDSDLDLIGHTTACVVMEVVQGALGYRVVDADYLRRVSKRCREVGALLIFDEVQTGLGRTGRLWGFEHSGVVPDILCLAKALGGGMPLGAFISSNEKMKQLTHDPPLGHISTFGGHPVCCAAGLAAWNELTKHQYWLQAEEKGQLFRRSLEHPMIEDITGTGLMLSVALSSRDLVGPLIRACLENRLLVDGFLHNDQSIRIAPPLIITEDEITWACQKLTTALDHLKEKGRS